MRRDVLARLAKGQQPYATILGCADSRVVPELIFDAVLGELFVVRVAGNVLSPEVAASFQYAGAHLQTPLFVVLGHEGCGAVKAALESRFEGVQHRSRIQLLVDGILPVLEGIDREQPPDVQLSTAVEANVRWTVRQILDSPEGQARFSEGRIRLMGAVYELESGRVRLLDQPPSPA
jgi:carbonic anhydrase